jgi:acylphosphatase
MSQRARLRIRGRVQGVFYRKSAEKEANSLGLSGWVRNMEDGSVEAFVLGPHEVIEKFAAWCKDGPPGARVDSVDIVWQAEVSDTEEKIEAGSRFRVTGNW